MCVITANKSKCDFFKDISIDKDSMSSMLNMKMKDLRDLDVCDPVSKFHNTSSPLYLAKPIIVYPAFVLQHMTSITATNNTKKKIADIKNKLVRNTKGMSPLSVAVMLPVLAYECSGYIDAGSYASDFSGGLYQV
jgi:hypothetical protein